MFYRGRNPEPESQNYVTATSAYIFHMAYNPYSTFFIY